MEESSQQANRRVYPLSVLFIVTAGCAIVAALMTPLLRAVGDGQVGLLEAGLIAIWGSGFGMAIGGVVGLYHFRRMRGLLWGLVTGMFVGAALGPLSLVPVDAVPSLFGLSLVGSAVLVAAAAAFRLSGRATG